MPAWPSSTASEIAAPAFRDNRYFFARSELTDRITEFLHDELNAPRHLDGNQVLNAIEVQQGLIVQRSQEAWSFSHLTLQEYLTAVWYKGNQQISELISNHLLDVRWREVFILLAGAIDKADDLLKQMLKTAEKSLTNAHRALQRLRWARHRAVPMEDPEQAAARRALVIALTRALARDRDRAVAFAHSLALALDFTLDHSRDGERALAFAREHALDHALALAGDRNRALAFNLSGTLSLDLELFESYVQNLLILLAELDSSQLVSGAWHEASRQVQFVCAQSGRSASPEEARKAWNQVLDIFSNTLQVPAELRDLTDDGHELDAYLYACQLIVDCKNAATRVSRSAWEDICQRMLNPPERPTSGGAHDDHRRKTRHAK